MGFRFFVRGVSDSFSMRLIAAALAIAFAFSFVSAGAARSQTLVPGLKQGTYEGHLYLRGEKVPFSLLIQSKPNDLRIAFLSGGETINISLAGFNGDTLWFRFPVYESEIRLGIKGDRLNGQWIKRNYGKETKWPVSLTRLIPTADNEAIISDADTARTSGDSLLAFTTVRAVPAAFTPPAIAFSVANRWSAFFMSGTGHKDTSKAIGLFSQDGNIIRGTFLAPDGDYRFLKGYATVDSLVLYGFDGATALAFKAKLSVPSDKRKQLIGELVTPSGKEKAILKENPTVQLTDLNVSSMQAYLKPGYDSLPFNLFDAGGKQVDLESPRYKGKTIVIQVMGSWCHNCMDETAFLTSLYNRHGLSKGIEVIGVAFERTTDPIDANRNLTAITERFEVPYSLVFAGSTAKESIPQAMPLVKALPAYPTTFILDRERQIKYAHYGFAGPATGDEHTKYTAAFERKLLEIAGR